MLVYFLLYVNWSRHSVSYLNVSLSGLITAVGEENEREDYSAIDLLVIMLFLFFLLVLRIGFVIVLWHSQLRTYMHITTQDKER